MTIIRSTLNGVSVVQLTVQVQFYFAHNLEKRALTKTIEDQRANVIIRFSIAHPANHGKVVLSKAV